MAPLAIFQACPKKHVIYDKKAATNTHTDCTQTHTRIAQNTHTDAHKHTHILLPIVVFTIKTWTKTHTYLERKSIFFGWGLPQQ